MAEEVSMVPSIGALILCGAMLIAAIILAFLITRDKKPPKVVKPLPELEETLPTEELYVASLATLRRRLADALGERDTLLDEIDNLQKTIQILAAETAKQERLKSRYWKQLNNHRSKAK